MLRDILVVYAKELREVLRDRKTLVFMILLPLALVPVLGQLGMSYVSELEKKAATEPLPHAIFGAEHAPGISEALSPTRGFERVELASVEEIREAIEDDRLKLALVLVPEDGRVVAELHYDNALFSSNVAGRVKEAIEAYNASERDEQLIDLGLRTEEDRSALLEPVALRQHGLATQRELLGEALGGTLTYVFIVFCFLGAMYPAIDLGAGEKERQTLETLLLSPVPRAWLVLGKFAVVFTTGLVSALLTLGSIAVWIAFNASNLPGPFGELVSTLTLSDFALMGALLLPINAIFAALLLGISVYAKSFKEAQSYMTPLNVLVIMPAFVGMLPGVTLDWRWAVVPVSNVALAVKEIVKGTIDPTMLAAIFVSSTALALAMLGATSRWFQRETVLFRQ